MAFHGTYTLNPFNNVYCVNNSDFNDWRTSNQKGGDFRVFSDIEEHKLPSPYVFYVPYKFKEKDTPKKEENSQKNDAKSSKKYTIKSGDTLWDLAVKEYGNGHLWKKIRDENIDVIGDHKKMQPGTVITIPK
jgi:LysM repeat protein